MSDYMWTKYRRKGAVELRPLLEEETPGILLSKEISVSVPDQNLPLATFKLGKIARNPDNPADQWYVAADYFNKNYEELPLDRSL